MNRYKYSILENLTKTIIKYKHTSIIKDVDKFIKEITIDFNIKSFYPTCDKLIDYLLKHFNIELEIFFDNIYDKINYLTNTEEVFKTFIKSNIDVGKKRDEIYYCKLSLNDRAQNYYKKFFVLQAILSVILYLNKDFKLLNNEYKTYNTYFGYIINNLLIPNELFFQCLEKNLSKIQLSEYFNTNEEIIKLKFIENKLEY